MEPLVLASSCFTEMLNGYLHVAMLHLSTLVINLNMGMGYTISNH